MVRGFIYKLTIILTFNLNFFHISYNFVGCSTANLKP